MIQVHYYLTDSLPAVLDFPIRHVQHLRQYQGTEYCITKAITDVVFQDGCLNLESGFHQNRYFHQVLRLFFPSDFINFDAYPELQSI